MSKLVEKMALRACQARRAALKNQPLTDAVLFAHLPESELVAARAALAVVMAEMREPSEGMVEAIEGAYEETDGGGDMMDIWRCALAQFEKENQ